MNPLIHLCIPWPIHTYLYRSDEANPPMQRFESIIKDRTAAFLSSEKRDKPSSDASPPPDMLSELLHVTTKRANWTPAYASTMGSANFIAGHETTTSIATSALFRIFSDPAIQARVHAELDANTNTNTNDDDDDACVYTHACIKEALRLDTVTSLPLWRKVPAGGPPLALHGHAIPPGTTVGVSMPALHSNPAVFGADAGTFRPERWLEGDHRRRRTSLAWGGGAHTCPGRNLAEMMLAKVVLGVLRGFEGEVVGVRGGREMGSFTYVAMRLGIEVRFWERGKGSV